MYTLKYAFTFNAQSNKILSEARNLWNDISIIVEEDDDRPPYFTFSSYHLNELDNPEDVWSRGQSLLLLFKGYLNSSFNPLIGENFIDSISLVSLYELENNSNITPRNANILLPSYPFVSDFSKMHRLPDNSLIAHSISKEDFRSLLLQLGNGINWVNLYSVLDTLEYFSNEKGLLFDMIVKNAGYNKNDLKAFTGTANNFGLLNILARHGERGWSSPKSTMNLIDSQSLIISLCNEYFNQRIKQEPSILLTAS
jgi:hypothetical protein